MSYADKLRRPEWQEKRAAILKRARELCENCGEGGRLHVHHKLYIAGREPWEYKDDQLIALCPSCHKYAHIEMAAGYNALMEIMASLPLDGPCSQNEVAYLVAGFCGQTLSPKSAYSKRLELFGRFARESCDLKDERIFRNFMDKIDEEAS